MIYTEALTLDEALAEIAERRRKRVRPSRSRNSALGRTLQVEKNKREISLPKVVLPEIKWD
jgi:hypothetical protein